MDYYRGRNIEVAAILGAKGHTAIVLQDYIAGYSFSIIGQALYPLLLWFLNFNGNEKISKTSIALMCVLNLCLDMLLAVRFDMGAFGLGLATSLSYLITCAYVFREFLINYGWGRTTFTTIRWGELKEAVKIGKPSLTFNHADAFGSLGSVHYAAKDKDAFVKSARFALKSCIIFSSIAMLSLMFAADDITEIYFKPTEEAWAISKRMLWIFPSFLVLNGICGIFMRACNLKEEYRTQHKDAWLVDGMPLFENVMMAFLSAMFLPFIGSDGVWLSFPATELICIAIIACTVFKNAGKVTFKLDDWLKVEDNFGKAPTLERAFNSMEDVVEVSVDVVKFCESNRVEENLATMAGVVTEELSGNVLLHGVKASENCSSYIRVTLKDGLNIRIYDDNNEFNSRKEMKKIESEPARSGEEKIGLRLVKSITDRYGAFDYQNTAGINTSIIKLRNFDWK